MLNTGPVTIAAANTPQLVVPANIARRDLLITVDGAGSAGAPSGSGLFFGSNQQITTATGFQLLNAQTTRFTDKDDIWVVSATAGKTFWFAEEVQDQEPGTANTFNFARVIVATRDPVQVVFANPHRLRLTITTRFGNIWVGPDHGVLPGNGHQLVPNVPNVFTYNGDVWAIASRFDDSSPLGIMQGPFGPKPIANDRIADLTYLDEVNF